jgi:hypothetical protein
MSVGELVVGVGVVFGKAGKKKQVEREYKEGRLEKRPLT